MLVCERPLTRWVVALVTVVAVVGLNLLVQPLMGGQGPLLPLLPTVIGIALVCGAGPALASVAVAAAAIAVFWLEPRGALMLAGKPGAGLLVIFLVVAGIGAVLAGRIHRAVLELEHTRTRLNLALTAGRMAAWEWVPATDAVTFSGAAEAVFGAAWADFNPWFGAAHPQDAARLRSDILAVKARDPEHGLVHRIVRRDTGSIGWIETHVHVHRDAAGQAVKVTGVTADVTAMQQALDEARRVAQRFEVALEGSGILMWECNAERRYTWTHNTPSGAAADPLIGRRVGDIAAAPGYPEAVEHVFETGEPVRGLAVSAEVRGRVTHYLANIEPVKDAEGRVVRLIGALMNVSRLRLAQQRLEAEGQRKDAFLATLAHELRNPMAATRYAVALLRHDPPPPARQRAFEAIERQSAHMARLLEDLLDLSRITRDVIELRREHVDLRSVVEEAADVARATLAAGRHRLSIDVPAAPVRVDGDPTRLQQIIGNLLDNAAKYTPPGGHIALSLAVAGGEAVVTVQDDGSGLAPEMLPQVFEHFTRFHRDMAGAHGGLGIGLAVVKKLVALHGGSIAAASDGLGRGASFTVRLPLVVVDAVPSREVDGTAGSWQGGGRLVLVVDDNRDAADTLGELLRADGWRVTVAYDGQGALAAFGAVQPDVVLLDIGLPDLSGHEVAGQIRLRHPHSGARLVAITGWGQPHDRMTSLAAGFDLHLVKPLSLGQIRQALAELLAHRGSGVMPANPS